MNRRTYLKSFAIFGVLASSFSIYKWTELNRSVVPADFWEKEALIAELAEIIIPETDTPGAKSAKVHLYIINVLTNCLDVKVQNHFLRGLNEVDAFASTNFDKPFLKCNEREKMEVVDYFSKHANYDLPILNKISNKILGEGFFSKLRGLTIEGYCRSELGASKGLVYDYIPGSYEACIPLQKGQKSWATK